MGPVTAPTDHPNATAAHRERLQAIRDRARASFAENLSTIDAAIGRLAGGALDEPERRAAMYAAHRLAGAAGTFGFGEATGPAQRLEESFAAGPPPDQADRLAAEADALRVALSTEESGRDR
jgi:HPt (histidine-containing phosphotransfer) domain-containing protein